MLHVNPIKISLCAILAFSGIVLNAQSRQQLETKRKKVQQDIEFTKQILNKTTKEKTATLHKLGAINNIIQKREVVIGQLKSELTVTDSAIVQKQAGLLGLQAQYNIEQQKLRKAIRQAYKTRKSTNKLAFIFASASFKQAVKRMKYLKKLSDYRRFLIAEIQEKAATVDLNLKELKVVQNEKAGLLKGSEEEKSKLVSDVQQKKNMVAVLAGQETQLRKKLKDNERAIQQLNSSISGMIAGEIAAARRAAEKRNPPKVAASNPKPSTTKSGSTPGPRGTVAASKPAPAASTSSAALLTPAAQALSASFAGNIGRLPWPVERGYISQSFGLHSHPDLPGITLINNGVDISTGEGNSAKAVFKGTVSAIISIPGQEKAVLVNHGEYYTVYSRLSSVSVTKGQEISAGQVLGTVWTDDEGKTILQFQVWKGQVKQNPASWLLAR